MCVIYVKLKGATKCLAAHEKVEEKKINCPTLLINENISRMQEQALSICRAGEETKRQLNVAVVIAYCNTVLVSLSFVADLGPRLVKGLDYSPAH